jgi:hypothetical protein
MKKVLIVSPHFPPINAPDMQRVRLMLPHLRAAGWEPTVLAVAPESIEGGVLETALEQTYPADVRVIRVVGIAPGRTRWFGVGNLWWRCGRALTDAGEELLQRERFDVVFFSTTQFSAFALGPKWKARFGVPYVLDYQDPWVNDYYERARVSPPGGRLRFGLSQWRARRTEPGVLREAAAVIAVSDSYPPMLARSYPWFDAREVRVLPFGATENDFAVAEQHPPRQPLVDFGDGMFHHVYTGRCGPDMADALRILFRAFGQFRAAQPAEARRMRFHFIGTGYAPPPLGEKSVMPIAQAEGVAEQVEEQPYRIPYFESLWYLKRAHALVAVGSNDATYSASKIFPYTLARKPLLLVFHTNSLVMKFAETVRVGTRVGFTSDADIDRMAERLKRSWFESRAYEHRSDFDEAAFAPYSAAAMTTEVAKVFEFAVK